MARVLIVDDVEDNIHLLKFELEDDGHEVMSLNNGQECLDQFATLAPEIIFLDLHMPVLDGMATLRALKSQRESASVPVIMVSANDEEEAIIEALDLGAHDFVNKPFVYPILAARMRSALRIKESEKLLSKANESLARLASTDSLTEVYNRRYFFEQAHSEFSRAERHHRALSVIMIDADHFKEVNDQYGHSMGDQVLVQLAKICSAHIRTTDFLGRLGGEEFAICCPETGLDGALVMAERIRQSVAQHPIHYDNHWCSITISVGVAVLNEGDKAFSDVQDRSDRLLYMAKKQGRNCVVGETSRSS